MQTLTILGSTGSIGVSTLDVVARHPDRFEIYALAGHRQIDKLAQQCAQHRPKIAIVANKDLALKLQLLIQHTSPDTQILYGEQALRGRYSAQSNECFPYSLQQGCCTTLDIVR